MNKMFAIAFAALFLAMTPLAAHAQSVDAAFQASTIDALLAGAYDGDMPFSELKKHGDFGLGTVNALDGEMIGLDGRFYRVALDGSVHAVPDEEMTPFADVAFFEPEQQVTIKEGADLDGLKAAVDAALPSKNLFYAVRVTGTFASLTARSVPRQEKPYQPLTEAVKKQNVFHFENIKGTLVGFRCPENVGGLGVPGYHFHFLSADGKRGGHVLTLTTGKALAEIDVLDAYTVVLPKTGEFLARAPGGDDNALDAVEKK
jgi:acetolactate decarboxylase